MSGIYIHIPFCKKACHYCDFHFSTSLKYKDEMMNAIIKELVFRKNYLENEEINTVYLGGGTPSLLNDSEINRIYDSLQVNFNFAREIEFTMEANPDDLSKEKIREFKNTPINRLSIGTQSFFEEDLIWMNRSHTAQQSIDCVKRVQDSEYENINIDLIYGYPNLSMEKWKKNIKIFTELNIPHLSAYSLTVEEKTALYFQIQNGKSPKLKEGEANAHFEILMQQMEDFNFLHYEISNYCKPGFESKHNSNYWQNKKYLGLGPSAHSYDLESRQWNVSNNNLYMDGVLRGKLNFEKEELGIKEKVNEQILTRLRTIWGFDIAFVPDENMEKFIVVLEDYLDKGLLVKNANTIRLTKKGYLFADKISSDLFI